MTPEQIAFRGIIYGGAITLAGTLLANLVQILLQWLQHKWAMSAEKKKLFAEKRLNALQNTIQLCDFLSTLRPSQDIGSSAAQDWIRIRRENLAHGALLPRSLQSEFQKVLRLMDSDPYHGRTVGNPLPSVPATTKLRELCVEAIGREYDKV